jgi:TetR/AcrR family transcriptional regulator, cholesterol catabolism regulator
MSIPKPPVKGPRNTIFEVATKLFSERGYAGTTMRDIAELVGVLPGSLYAHIEGKEALLFEIVETGIGRFLAAAESAADIADPVERARAMIRAHVAVVADNPERTLVVFHQWRYLTGPKLARVMDKRQRYEDVFTEIFEAGVASGAFSARLDTKVAVLSMLGSLNWTAQWIKPDGRSRPEEIGGRLADAILWGLISE